MKKKEIFWWTIFFIYWITLGSFIGFQILNDYENKEKGFEEAKCYDKYNHEIVGDVCLEPVGYNSKMEFNLERITMAILGATLFPPALGSIFMACGSIWYSVRFAKK